MSRIGQATGIVNAVNDLNGFAGVRYDGAQIHQDHVQTNLAAVHARIFELEQDLATAKESTAAMKRDMSAMEERLSASELAVKDMERMTTAAPNKRARTAERGERKKRDTTAEAST